jgi:hypothetical protein
MDGQRFDELARLVATGVPRRRVLGMIAGGVAAVFARGGSASAGICLNEGDACDGVTNPCCGDLVCDVGGSDTCVQAAVCIGEDGSCGVLTAGGPAAECCADLECVDDVCIPFQTPCADVGEACSDLAGANPPCCDGLICVQGFCEVPEPKCVVEGATCGGKGDPDCCDSLECVEGTCQAPEPICIEQGESCNGGAGVEVGCCEGLVCIDGLCNPPAECRPEGEECEGDLDCCAGICCAGFCRDIECCIDEPSPNDRCDDGQTCFEGICQGVTEICESDDDCVDGACCCDDGGCDEDCCEEEVTQLPGTGVGGGGKRSSKGWMAAAAGAAAAFVAGKKLKRDPKPAEPAE